MISVIKCKYFNSACYLLPKMLLLFSLGNILIKNLVIQEISIINQTTILHHKVKIGRSRSS